MGLFGRGTPAAPGAPAVDPVVLELSERLRSLDQHCLTGLGAGLEAMTRGDLTVEVQPVTNFMVFRYELIKGTSSDGSTKGDNMYPAPTLRANPGDRLRSWA